MALKALKGFADLHYAPLTADTDAAYTMDTFVALPGAQSLSPTDQRTDYEILADDTIYAQGSDYKNTELVITVAEMSLEDEAALAGFTFDSTKKVQQQSVTDEAPYVALSFSALRSDGGKRLYKYFAAKLKSCKVQPKTKGQNGDIAAYELTFTAQGRKLDGLVRETKDAESGDSLEWLTSDTATA